MAYSKDYQCKFCGVKFHKEITLSTHICVKKRRHMEIDSQASRFGFRTFQKFYEMTTNSKKPKTTDEFINSPYYIDFVKFGNHLATLKPVYPERFIEFVIKNSVNLKDWCKDFVYYLYVEDLVKQEPAVSATERTISEIVKWCEKNSVEFVEFFEKVSANEAAAMIKTGKLSPWVLYLSGTGDSLIASFNEYHARDIGSIIDAGYWMKRFKKHSDDVDFIKNLLENVRL